MNTLPCVNKEPYFAYLGEIDEENQIGSLIKKGDNSVQSLSIHKIVAPYQVVFPNFSAFQTERIVPKYSLILTNTVYTACFSAIVAVAPSAGAVPTLFGAFGGMVLARAVGVDLIHALADTLMTGGVFAAATLDIGTILGGKIETLDAIGAIAIAARMVALSVHSILNQRDVNRIVRENINTGIYTGSLAGIIAISFASRAVPLVIITVGGIAAGIFSLIQVIMQSRSFRFNLNPD